MKVHLRTLGELDLRGAHDSELRSVLVQPKRIALLTYLAVARPHGFHRRDSLLALLWPDQDSDHARGSLRQALYGLRRSLGEGVLLTRGEDLALDGNGFTCDVWSFEKAVQDHAAVDAVAAYGGEFLRGFFLAGAPEFEQWVEAERGRLSHAYAAILERLAEDTSREDLTCALDYWRRLAEHDPYSSRVALRLMQTLEAVGDAPSAILHSEQHAGLLREQLDAEPDPDVVALAERLRKHPAAAGPGAGGHARTPLPDSSAGTGPAEGRPGPTVAQSAPLLESPAALAAGRRPWARDLSLGAAAGVLVGAPAALLGAGLLHAVAPRIVPLAITGAPLALAAGLVLLDSAAALLIPRAHSMSRFARGGGGPGGPRRIGAGFGFVLGVLVSLSGAYTLAPRDDSPRPPAGSERPGLSGGSAPGDARVRQRNSSSNARADELYARGRLNLNRWNEVALDSAIIALEGAVAADSSFAAARAALANAYLEKADIFDPRDELRARAYVQTQTALLIDPDLAEAHLARGNLLWTDANHFPHEAALREFARAAQLDPRLSSAHDRLALVYIHVGLLDRALVEARQAAALDPLDHWARLRVGHVLVSQQRFREAAEELQGLPPEVAPVLRGAWLAEALLNVGQAQQAQRMLDELVVRHPRDPLVRATRAVVFASRRDSARATADIDAAVRRLPGFAHAHHAQLALGEAYALLGNPDSAIRWLDRAARNGFPCYPRYARDSLLNSLRRDPRFIELLRRLKAESDDYGRKFATLSPPGAPRP